MKIYPSTVKVLVPPTSIIKVLKAENLSFANDNISQLVGLHLLKLSSNQALHVLSNLISQGLVTYEDAEYEVESIEDHSWDDEEQIMYYLIKWRGWPTECCTWECEADLANCQELLAEYKNFISGKSRKRGPTSGELSDSAERSKARVLQLLDCINFDGLTPERFESTLAETLSKRALQSVGNRRNLPRRGLARGRESRRSLAVKAVAELKLWERELNAKEPQARIVIENKVDLEGPPSAFTYVTERVPAPGVSIPSDPVLGCCCTDCFEERRTCVANHVHNEGRVPYNRQGRLSNVEASYPIHECNSLCTCGPDCPFRVVQRGRRYALAIFRTKNRGWGVRALQRIPRGAFVVEYVGEVVTCEEAERRGLQYDREGQTYLFDLDLDGDPVYSVDARDVGNVAHFLNHSCNPNLTIRCVYTQCIDKDLPLLALFANDTIPSGTELTFDYQMSGAISAAVAVVGNGVSPNASTSASNPSGSDGVDQQQQQQVAESETEPQRNQVDNAESAMPQTLLAPAMITDSGDAQSENGSSASGPAKIRCLCGAPNCRKYLF